MARKNVFDINRFAITFMKKKLLSFFKGDQIGRIFAVFLFTDINKTLGATFFRGKMYALFGQKWLGYLLGDFFTNSSGHSAF
jgi:hypothetical protein